MTRLRALADSRRANAVTAWLATAVLVLATGWLAATGQLLWPIFGLLTVGIVVVPPVLTRDRWTTMPGELVALVALPVVLRAAGASVGVTPFAAVATLALLVVVALDAFTSLDMTPRFAVAFVVVTTMAFAGTWAVGEFATDALLGTRFVEGQREMNLDLLTATVVGLLAGVLFVAYFREAGRVGHLREAAESLRGDGVDGVDEPADAADDEHGVDHSPKFKVAIRALQAVLVVIVVYSVVRLKGGLFVNSAVPLALTLLPAAARWRYDYPMHAGLALLIALAATLHAVGALGPYRSVEGYDSVAHALSSMLVAGVGYAIAHGLDLHSDHVSFSPRFRAAFVILFVLAVGVLWELLEFGAGLAAVLLGGEAVLAQYGVEDIVNDLVFNFAGAVLVALWGTGLFRQPARVLSTGVGGLFRRK